MYACMYGVGTNGVTANFMFFDRGTSWVPICQHLSTSVNIRQHPSTSVNSAYLSTQYIKQHYFCSYPISVDPVCPQPSNANSDIIYQHMLINYFINHDM